MTRCDDPACRCSLPEWGAVDFGDDRLDTTQRKVRSAAFLELLCAGRPASNETVARDAGSPICLVREVLAQFAERGSAQFDGKDRIVGIAGISIEPTRHTLDLPPGKRWTWCALDAVGIVGALGSGTITSTGPGGDFAIGYHKGCFDPADLVIFIADGYGITSSIGGWCPLVDFFPSIPAAEDWARERGIEGRGVPVRHLASIAAERWRTIIEE
jgi:hypothetical protein